MSAIPSDCIRAAADSLGGPLTQEQLGFLQDEVTRLQSSLAQQGQLANAANVLLIAARKFGAQQKLAAAIEKRNAVLNQQRYFQSLAYVTTTWKGKEAEGLQALLTGSIRGRAGARNSAALQQKILAGQYLGGINVELERAGVMEGLRSGSIDRPVGRALWQLSSAAPRLDDIPADAVKAAKIAHKYQELARADANRAGAWIGKLEGWIVRQSHDLYKISKAGFAKWAGLVESKLDWSRIEAERGAIKDRRAFLKEVYTGLASGVHIKAAGEANDTGFRGPRNIGKSMSAERVLHFKDADAWMDYNDVFGSGNIREALFHGLNRSAQNTGLMRAMGPNPQAMLQRLVDEIGRRIDATADPKALKNFSNKTKPGGALWNSMAQLDGSVNIPVDQIKARVGSNLRAWQSMSKLGGAVISSVTDIATAASEASYQGRGFLTGMAESLAAVAEGRPTGERQEILSSLGVFFESVTSSLTREGSLDESFGGWTSRSMQQFFKWNLLNWWTDSLRGSAALAMSHNLGENAGKVWGALNPDLRHTLQLFGVNELDWNVLRKGVRTAEDGRKYMVPDGLDDRRANQLRQFIVDRAHTAVLEPDAGTMARYTRRGLRRGDFTGELNAFLMQFKGFPIAFTRQVLGRDIYGRGADAFAEGSIPAVAKLIAATTILGYGAMAAKDMIRGKKPRDPSDPRTILAAMVQGGGAGIYGDFLFGEFNRFGRSPLEALAGPVAGTGQEIVTMWSQLVRGDADGGQALRLAMGNTPFLNLFYTRPVLDYLILYQVQESISPGTLRRLERSTLKNQGQEYWLKPSEAVGR